MEAGIEEDVAGPFAVWHSSVPSMKGPQVVALDKVGKLSAGLSNSVAPGSPVLVICVELGW